MTAYYNEIDPFAAAWLRELITAGHIAPGDVDDRSILDVRPSDLVGYTQCHFFAGIGVWSYALRRAGWPDNRPVWTGSCPCQPFSAAGKGGGFDDERHLWPHFYWLIGERRPSSIFGEQVAAKNADPWVDLVQADLEALGYAFGAVPFPSAGIGAPHIRDRTYWMADAASSGSGTGLRDRRSSGQWGLLAPDGGAVRGLADADSRDAEQPARQWAGSDEAQGRWTPGRLTGRSDTGGLEHAASDGRIERWPEPGGRGVAAGRGTGGLVDPDRSGTGALAGDHREVGAEAFGGTGSDDRSALRDGASPIGGVAHTFSDGRGKSRNRNNGGDDGSQLDTNGRDDWTGPVNGIWRDADWLHCRDHKWRPVEPGTFPLAHGAPARVGRLRGYGNAINAEAAVAFIEAATDHEIVDLDAERLRLTGAFA